MSSIPFVLKVRPHKCLCGKPCPGEEVERLRQVERNLESITKDNERKRDWRLLAQKAEERVEELERLLAARVEHCQRVHACRQEVT